MNVPWRTRKICTALVLVCALVVAAPAAAQMDRSTITGVVKDSQGGVVPGATVTALSEQTKQTTVTVTDAGGFFTLPNLMPAYARLLQQRVFDPLGMSDAAIAADPRPLGEDWAGSYTRDLFDRLAPLPFVSIDGYAPAGAHVASAMDMARYLFICMIR